eukprot:TRINITY_DN61823_c0_g3_i1.p1 TRINITY_DN61823_c0_g3~~TRINITY_DN61823_c0_g3_i1.p1  ORF type:complete len:417 (+),score=50.63 TRINITY_DN61823_c0_g3_i1:30-1253(+)
MQLLLVCFVALVANCVASLDLRVSPALGAHGRGKVRISVIDNSPTETYNGFFDYNSEFRWRWTNNSRSLHTALKPIVPGDLTIFNIGGQSVSIKVPKPGQGVKGVIFGDPCAKFTGFLFPCVDDVEERLPTLLNLIAADLDWWSILGDNFYDLTGQITTQFFSNLGQSIKQVPLITTPGNHDYWVLGFPELGEPWDQFGNGFMQYYGQDTLSGKANPRYPLDFSVQPGLSMKPAALSNFFQYKVFGNLGFITFSSVYTWEQSETYFEEACDYMAAEKPDFLFLVNHWSSCGAGCKPGMNATGVYNKIKYFKGCNIPNFKNLYGHTHCNKKMSDESYLIGATGFLQDCFQAGFIYIKTTPAPHTNMEMINFDFSHKTNYNNLASCFAREMSLDQCTHLGTVWYNGTLN